MFEENAQPLEFIKNIREIVKKTQDKAQSEELNTFEEEEDEEDFQPFGGGATIFETLVNNLRKTFELQEGIEIASVYLDQEATVTLNSFRYLTKRLRILQTKS